MNAPDAVVDAVETRRRDAATDAATVSPAMTQRTRSRTRLDAVADAGGTRPPPLKGDAPQRHPANQGEGSSSQPAGRWSIAQVRAINRGDNPTDDHPAAVALIDAGRLEVVERTRRRVIVHVTSRSQPDTIRRVTAEGDRFTCDCPAYIHRRRCAHVNAAALVVAPPGYRRMPPATGSNRP